MLKKCILALDIFKNSTFETLGISFVYDEIQIPILIGGGGEKVTLRITAQYADIWHGFATKTEERSGIETVAHKNKVLDNWCKEIGRDPKEIKRSIGIDIKRIDLADELIEAGATEVTLAVNGPGYDLTDVKEWIAWRDSKN